MDCFSLGGLVEMKIHYRTRNILDDMNDAVANRDKPIEFFELTSEELNSYYTHFDRNNISPTEVTYSYKGTPIKVKE